MNSLAREFKELEARSQLPPSTLQQCVTPATVFLPAAVSAALPQLAAVVGPPCASAVGTTMPQSSPTVAGSATTVITSQGSIQMCMTPLLGFSSFPGPPPLNENTTWQATADGYTAPAVGSASGEDSVFGIPIPASSTPASRLSPSAQESLFVMNYTTTHPCNARDAPSATDTAFGLGNGSGRDNQTDVRLDRDQRCLTAPSYPNAQAHPQQPRPADDAPLARVGTPLHGPVNSNILGVSGATQRVVYQHTHAPLLREFPEVVCTIHSLTSAMESTTTTTPPSAPLIPPTQASREEANGECRSIVFQKSSSPQISRQQSLTPQTPLSSTTTITDSASATSQTIAHVPWSLQERRMIMIATSVISGGAGGSTPSSPLPIAPPQPSPPCFPGSAPSQSTNVVDAKPNGDQGGRKVSTSVATTTAAAFAPCRLASSPTPAAATTSPPPPQNIRLGSIPGTIAFLPLEVQPDITTTPPSIRAVGAYRSPAYAAFSTSGDPAVASLSVTNTVPSMLSASTITALEQPSQASADSLAAVTPPPPHTVSPTSQPLHPPTFLSLPCVPTGSMTVLFAAPEMNWQSLTSGGPTPPASTIGSSVSDVCGKNGAAGYGVGVTGSSITDGGSSPASTATPRAVSPRILTAPSMAFESQRAGGSRGATWASSGQTYQSVLLHSGGGTSGQGTGVTTAVTPSVSVYGPGLPLFYSQPQLLCTPVPFDDTESLCAICLEGQVSNATAAPSSPPPVQPSRAVEEEGSGRDSDSATAVKSSASISSEGVEHGVVRGVKPGSRLLSLPCGHCYHQNCVQRWLMESQSCPTCRRDLTRDATVH